MGKNKKMTKLTQMAKGRSVGLQRKLFLYWASMVLAVFAVSILIMSIAGIFSSLDQNVYQTLQVCHENNSRTMKEQMRRLTAEGILISEEISEILRKDLHLEDVEALNDQPDLLKELEFLGAQRLEIRLKAGFCNGAYFLVDAAMNTSAEHAKQSRAGVYLRYSNLSNTDAVDQDIILFRGIADVAREKRMELHNRWNLEFDIERVTGYEAFMEQQIERVADGCVWTSRESLPDTWENVILLMVPILSDNGSVQGICGVELSELFLKHYYPIYEYEYGNMVTILAPLEDQCLNLEKGMTGSLKGTYLEGDEMLTIEEGKYFCTYRSGDEKYYGMHSPISVTAQDGSPLQVVTLMPAELFASERLYSNLIWTAGALGFLLSMLGLAFILTRNFVKPIASSLSAMMESADVEAESSGITEIDKIFQFVQERARLYENQEVQVSDLPPNIEELLQEFAQRVTTLTPTEHTILQYYIDGYTLEEVADLACISINTAKKHNTNVNRKLSVKSREELSLYIDLFRRGGRLSDISCLKEK